MPYFVYNNDVSSFAMMVFTENKSTSRKGMEELVLKILKIRTEVINKITEKDMRVTFNPSVGIKKNPQSKVETMPPTVDIAYTLPLMSPADSIVIVFMRTNKGVVHPKKNIGKNINPDALKITANLKLI